MKPVNQLPIKVGCKYHLASYRPNFGAFFSTVEILEIKEGKHSQYQSGNFYSIKILTLNTPYPYGAAAGSESWIHNEWENNMESRWLHIDGNYVMKADD